jgi:hypothetical protein
VLDTLKKGHGLLIIISLMEKAKMGTEEHLELDIYQIQMKEKEYLLFWLRHSRGNIPS